MKHILALLALLLTSMGITAAPRTADQARAAARQILSRHAARKAPGHAATVAREPSLVAQAQRTRGEAYYYVFSQGVDEGYAIISGDDRLPAVVGYAERGCFADGDTPPALDAFLHQYRDFLDHASDEQIRQVAAFKAQARHAAVEPFVKTKWDQREPYNNMCPNYNGQRCLTGCVATAVAQVLRYYNAPDALRKSIPAYNTKTHSLRQTAISAGQAYDWASMLDAYDGGESATEKTAVAKLLYHVGCAFAMDYDTQASAAAIRPEVLTATFGLDAETTRLVQRSGYALADWDAMLYAEIQARRPVLYAGASTGGAHEFVVHGYDDGLYYVNWGWGGLSDGYFDITILNPQNSSGAGASTSGDGYSFNNDMVIGLQPDNGRVDPRHEGVFTSKGNGREVFTDFALSGLNVTATARLQIYNFNAQANKRQVSVGYDSGAGIVNVGTPLSLDIKGMEGDTGFGIKDNCAVAFKAEEGKTYTLFAIESADKKSWLPCQKGDRAEATIKISGGKLLEAQPAKLSATVALADGSSGYAQMNNTVDVTVKNSGDAEYYGRLYIMASTTATRPTAYTHCQGVTVTGGDSFTLSFRYTPKAAGTVNFWVLDENQKEIGTGSIGFSATAKAALTLRSVKLATPSKGRGYHKFATQTQSRVNTYNVDMDEVQGEAADFSFEIRNDGGYYEGEFPVFYYDGQRGTWVSTGTQTLRLAANATTTVTLTARGAKGQVVGAKLASYEGNGELTIATTPIIHNTDQSGYFSFRDSEIAYLLGTPTAIAAPAMSGETSSAPRYNLNGQRVGTAARGIVIQNGRKSLRR